ncbi:MAG: hypothetical protein HY773_01280, partial [Candidatus Terrybacteria bacterium]|nr:hypothetical protein [Candidatus Terrybacteria bacterium]
MNRQILIFIIILFLIGSSLGIFYPKKTQAGLASGSVISDPVHTAVTTTHTISTTAGWVEKAFNDYIKPIAITILRKAILDRIVDQIIAWISGEGDPQFVTDWQ